MSSPRRERHTHTLVLSAVVSFGLIELEVSMPPLKTGRALVALSSPDAVGVKRESKAISSSKEVNFSLIAFNML